MVDLTLPRPLDLDLSFSESNFFIASSNLLRTVGSKSERRVTTMCNFFEASFS
jgi:hypothetical protein